MQEWPGEFLGRMKLLMGDDYRSFLQGLSEPAPVSIRINPEKRINNFQDQQKVKWCEAGYYLDKRPSFTFDPLFHAGCYYVQEASSMFLESVFKHCFPGDDPLKALDLCAAPGGKSTHLSSLLPADSILVSNEIIPQRNKTLRHNLAKWGDSNVIVTQQEVDDFLPLSGYFDLILVDAPCSGEGLFRRDPNAANEWSEDAVNHCAHRQENILNTAIKLLKPGGVLIYCTCTFENSENESQIERLIKENNAELIELNSGFEEIVKTGFGLRFYPHRVMGEGFFISAIRNIDGEEGVLKKIKSDKSSSAGHDFLNRFLREPEAFSSIQKENTLYAIPNHMLPLFQFMENKFYIRQAGIRIGEIKGADLQPAYELALSSNIAKDIPLYNFSLEDAIRYLRCDMVTCQNAEKGWTLAAYEGCPIGWIKVLDHRVNNYFPKELRVLKEYVPE
ncbi:MAG: hypothetical protein KA444_02800 [Bacteroidia bacterium]|nr:hypothetical protein [Bacteroidia bacterium]